MQENVFQKGACLTYAELEEAEQGPIGLVKYNEICCEHICVGSILVPTVSLPHLSLPGFSLSCV